MTNEIDSCTAREEASQYGVIIGTGDARMDGGWDFLVETDRGDMVCSVVRADNGDVCSCLG